MTIYALIQQHPFVAIAMFVLFCLIVIILAKLSDRKAN